MAIFEDREKAAERQYVQETELAFKIRAHRNRLLGLWAAGRMGLTGDAASRYAMSLVEAAVGEHDDQVIIKRICDDLVVSGVPAIEQEVREHLQAFAVKARAGFLHDARAKA
jgi:hypothetical protein